MKMVRWDEKGKTAMSDVSVSITRTGEKLKVETVLKVEHHNGYVYPGFYTRLDAQ
jgi:hypothetical protein